MLPLLNERQRRLFLATEAEAIGYGGVSQVSKVSGLSRVTITQGVKELKSEDVYTMSSERSRKGNGGRKKVTETYPGICTEIEELIKSHTKGNPENPLLWTSKSVRKIQAALEEKGIMVAHRTICDLLREMGYALLSNRKDLALKESHPDRNAQFEFINEQAPKFLAEHEPVISIDSKKKENIGNFKNNGAEWHKSK